MTSPPYAAHTSNTGAPPLATARAKNPRSLRADGYLIFVMLLTLTTVWRLQNTVPVLASLQLPTIAALGSYLFFLANRDRRRSLRAMKHPVTTALVVFLVCIAASAPLGAYFGNAFTFLRRDYIKTFLMFLVVVGSIRHMRDLETMVGAQLLGALLYCVVVLRRFQVGASGRLDELLYYDANDLAMVLAMTMPLAVYFLRPKSKTMWRLVSLSTFGVILLGIVKTGSRGGFLGIVAVMLYLVFKYSAIPRRIRLSAVGFFVLGLLVIGSDQYWKMMGTMLNPKEDYNYAGNSEGGRVEVWKRGFGYVKEYPLLGVGAANFGWAEENLGRGAQRKLEGKGTKRMTAHNSFVLAAAELGIIGFFVFCLVLIRAFKSLKLSIKLGDSAGTQDRDEAALGQALVASMIAFLVCGFFLSQTYAPALHVLLGLIVGLFKVQRDRLRALGAPPPVASRPSVQSPQPTSAWA